MPQYLRSYVLRAITGAIGDHRYHPTEIKGKVITEDNWNPYTLEELDKMVESGESG